jgi:hypothetical protein
MTIDELWSLHKRVSSELARKIVVQKTCLDQRLRQLAVEVDTKTSAARRPYPRVLPTRSGLARLGQDEANSRAGSLQS